MILDAIIQKDENGYFAFVPELSGCVTQADSYEEAISNIKEAAALYMESLQLDEIRHIQAKDTAIIQARFYTQKSLKSFLPFIESARE